MAELKPEELGRIADLVKKRIGVSLEEGKLMRMRRKIEGVMRSHGFEHFASFYHALRFKKDETLMQELLNAVTINETYFWREHKQFEICCSEILPEVAKRCDRIRILVAPCSSGEELYSIMIAILEEGEVIKRKEIEMVGIDIDSSMIAKAKEGIYSKRSVARLPERFLRKYFKPLGEKYRIDATLRRHAAFMVANIFDSKLPFRLGRFDILFSRNMLIYFNDEEKKRCFEQFERLLKPGGYLFLGHADANGIDKSRFKPLGYGLPIYRYEGKR